MAMRPARRQGLRLAGLLLALALSFLPAAAPAESIEALKHRLLLGLKGADNRRIVDTDAYPWSAVGRVNMRIGGFCTGTVIGPQEVLTAAHCLWNRRTHSWLLPAAIDFLVGYRRGEYLAHRKVESYVLADPAVTPETGEGRFRPKDWAILRLDERVDQVAGVLPLAPESLEAEEFAQVGYSQDKPHILTLDEGCRVEPRRAGAGLLRHWCDAVHGDSGSPLLAIVPAGMFVVGMHVATLVEGNERVGLAVPVTAMPAVAGR